MERIEIREPAGRGAPSLGSVVVWVATLVALGIVAVTWRSSLEGLDGQAAEADVAAFEEGVEALGAAVGEGDPFLAKSQVGTLRGLAANPATAGEAELAEAWRQAAAVTRRGSRLDLDDPVIAEQVLADARSAAAGLRAALSD